MFAQNRLKLKVLDVSISKLYSAYKATTYKTGSLPIITNKYLHLITLF